MKNYFNEFETTKFIEALQENPDLGKKCLNHISRCNYFDNCVELIEADEFSASLRFKQNISDKHAEFIGKRNYQAEKGAKLICALNSKKRFLNIRINLQDVKECLWLCTMAYNVMEMTED